MLFWTRGTAGTRGGMFGPAGAKDASGSPVAAPGVDPVDSVGVLMPGTDPRDGKGSGELAVVRGRRAGMPAPVSGTGGGTSSGTAA